MAKLKLDLHDFYNKGDLIDKLVCEQIDNCIEKKILLLEIIHGKGSGQLKKRVIRLLQSKEIKIKYHRLEKDRNNSGRLFVHFKNK